MCCFIKKIYLKMLKRRIKILKSSNDGFLIAEEDMKLRGFGDILGYPTKWQLKILN